MGDLRMSEASLNRAFYGLKAAVELKAELVKARCTNNQDAKVKAEIACASKLRYTQGAGMCPSAVDPAALEGAVSRNAVEVLWRYKLYEGEAWLAFTQSQLKVLVRQMQLHDNIESLFSEIAGADTEIDRAGLTTLVQRMGNRTMAKSPKNPGFFRQFVQLKSGQQTAQILTKQLDRAFHDLKAAQQLKMKLDALDLDTRAEGVEQERAHAEKEYLDMLHMVGPENQPIDADLRSAACICLSRGPLLLMFDRLLISAAVQCHLSPS
eukprot:SAG22_NODE_879_length_6707_cov_14.725787_3_plen_266_part_00